jgi:hypothetical protein
MSSKFRKQHKRLSIKRSRRRKEQDQRERRLEELIRILLDQEVYDITGHRRRPGLVTGALSISDPQGLLMPHVSDLYTGSSADESDANAIASDWEAVGQDLYVVLNDSEQRRKLLRSSDTD